MIMIIHMFRLLGLGARKVSTITSWSRAINSNGMRPVCMMLDVKRGLGLFHDRLPKASVSKDTFPFSWSARKALLAYLRRNVGGRLHSKSMSCEPLAGKGSSEAAVDSRQGN